MNVIKMMGPKIVVLVLVSSLVCGDEILVPESSNNLRRAVAKVHENVTEVGLNSRSLDEVLEIWNPRRIANLWNDIQSRVKVDGQCQNDVVRYFTGILKGEIWALQMMDASGKYTWGLLSSNNFWTGFPDQCRDLERMFAKKERSVEEMRSKVPPFSVAVYSVKLNLTLLAATISEKHHVTLGLCLPKHCSEQDVENLLKVSTNLSQTEKLPRLIEFHSIRNLSADNSIWDDSTFYIILVAFVIVTVLAVIGTLYDVFLRYKFLSKSSLQKETDFIQDFTYTPTANWKENITLKSIWSVKNHNGSFDISNSKEDPKPLTEALLSFSLLLNLSKMASFNAGSDTLKPIHGLRFFSMLWIILVHTCLIINEVSDSSLLRSDAESDFLYQTLSNGTYGVDTFFVISGCLVSFLYFRTIEKEALKAKKITQGGTGKVMQFLGMMSYRYFRLTPPYLVVLGMNQVAVRWIHQNLMIEFGQNDAETCPKFWWRNVLYINTYFPMEERCMVWSWYLANDTQFYTVGIIVLIIAASYFTVAAAIVAVFLVASWITTAVITLHTEHIPTIQDPFAQYESLYDKPWTRIGPYLIGMSVGWYLYKVKCKVNMHKLVKLIGWIISFSAMISIVYGIYGTNFGPVSSAMYTSFSHSGWAFCIGWILIACVTNNSGIINGILSWKYIYPISRLTYCAYLVHPAILRLMVLRGESSLHLTRSLMAIFFFGTVVASYAASLLLSLLFEAPMVSLLRIVHPMRVWRRK